MSFELTVDDALTFFSSIPVIKKKLETQEMLGLVI